MFLDDAAAGAQRQRGGFVRLFGAEQCLIRRSLRGRGTGKEIHLHALALAVRANEQGRMAFRIELTDDLSSKMQEDMQKLIGIREDLRER